MFVKIKLASELARNQMYQKLLGIDLTNLDTMNDKNTNRKLQQFYNFPHYFVSRKKIVTKNYVNDIYLRLLYLEYKNHKQLVKNYCKNKQYASVFFYLEKYESVLDSVGSVEELRMIIVQNTSIWLFLLRISAIVLLEKIPCYQTDIEATRWVYTKLNPFFNEDRILLQLMNPEDNAAIEDIDFNKFLFEPPYIENIALERVQSMLATYCNFSKSNEIIILKLLEEYVINIATKLEQKPEEAIFEKQVLEQLNQFSTREDFVTYFLKNASVQQRVIINYYQQTMNASLNLLESRAQIINHSPIYQKIKKIICFYEKGENPNEI